MATPQSSPATQDPEKANGTVNDSLQLEEDSNTSELVDSTDVEKVGVGVSLGSSDDSLGNGTGRESVLDSTGAEDPVVGSGVSVEGSDVVELTPGGPLYVRDEVGSTVKLDGVLNVDEGMTGNDVLE